jgi:rhodanese-related sulfurtransferase
MKHLLPRQAHDFIAQEPRAVFIDCRSDAEFFLIGHGFVATTDGKEIRPEHILWSDELRMENNPNFVAEVLAVTKTKDRPVVLICRSGRRTLLAGDALEAAGFTDVINVLHGFEGDRNDQEHRSKVNGWRFDGLPWEQM